MKTGLCALQNQYVIFGYIIVQLHGHVKAKQGGSRKGKLPEQNNDQTAKKLRDKIFEHFGFNVERSKAQRARHKLGWTLNGTRYCQIISETNKQNRLKFAVRCLKIMKILITLFSKIGRKLK